MKTFNDEFLVSAAKCCVLQAVQSLEIKSHIYIYLYIHTYIYIYIIFPVRFYWGVFCASVAFHINNSIRYF